MASPQELPGSSDHLTITTTGQGKRQRKQPSSLALTTF